MNDNKCKKNKYYYNKSNHLSNNIYSNKINNFSSNCNSPLNCLFEVENFLCNLNKVCKCIKLYHFFK